MRFAQRYPCRIVALCPRITKGGEDALSAKVFGECFIGSSRQEMSCCEAIIVGYSESQRGFLENQVSTFTETDLPVYFWPSRIRSAPKIGDYRFFLTHAKRIVIDSAIENSTVKEFAWPEAAMVKDLADARLLQVRQSIGQFLSSFAPSVLVDGLQSVEVAADETCLAEARFLSSWVTARIGACRRLSSSSPSRTRGHAHRARSEKESIAMCWTYAAIIDSSGRLISRPAGPGLRRISAGDPVELNSMVRLLSTPEALAEALFL